MSISEVERLECGAQYDECHVRTERDAALALIAALEAERDALNAGVERVLARVATLEAALREARAELRSAEKSYCNGELHHVSALAMGTIDAALKGCDGG